MKSLTEMVEIPRWLLVLLVASAGLNALYWALWRLVG